MVQEKVLVPGIDGHSEMQSLDISMVMITGSRYVLDLQYKRQAQPCQLTRGYLQQKPLRLPHFQLRATIGQSRVE